MKIYLLTDNGWKLYEGTLQELQPELEKRKIIIGMYCKIGSYCEIGSGCKIGKNSKFFNQNPFYIIGTKYIVNQYNNKWNLRIGCEIHSIKDWKKNYKKIHKNHNIIDKKLINEHYQYILLAEKLSKIK